MTCHISFRTAVFTDSGSSVTLVVTTDVASHLWARVTDQQPGIHTSTIMRRGLAMPSELYFCYVAYTDIEQLEAGDTLTHTFTVPDWPFCTTRWAHLWGSMAGVTCPSTSPSLKHHNSTSAPSWTIIVIEPWTVQPGLPPLTTVITEPWPANEPAWTGVINEPWTS